MDVQNLFIVIHSARQSLLSPSSRTPEEAVGWAMAEKYTSAMMMEEEGGRERRNNNDTFQWIPIQRILFLIGLILTISLCKPLLSLGRQLI
jgi:hypothetical protein